MGQRYISSDGYLWSYTKVDELCEFLSGANFTSCDFWRQKRTIPGMGSKFNWAYYNTFNHKTSSCPFGIYLTGFGFEVIAAEYYSDVFYQTIPWTKPKCTFDKILFGLNKCLAEVKVAQEVTNGI